MLTIASCTDCSNNIKPPKPRKKSAASRITFGGGNYYQMNQTGGQNYDFGNFDFNFGDAGGGHQLSEMKAKYGLTKEIEV